MIRKEGLGITICVDMAGSWSNRAGIRCVPWNYGLVSENHGNHITIKYVVLLGFCFSLAIIFGLTIAVSRMSIRLKNLTQEMALYMKHEEDRIRKAEEDEENINNSVNTSDCN